MVIPACIAKRRRSRKHRNISFSRHNDFRKAIRPFSSFHGRSGPGSAASQSALEGEVERLFAKAEQELAALPAEARETKPLRSLLNHREGLSVFVDKPQVPMDNNAVVATLATNGIDVRRWLQAWLRACACNGGQSPQDLSPWLPWSMSEERRRALIAPG